MLETLVIQNYALIEEVSLRFSSGFTVITGETGAGKSIMLDALSLLLGERADSKAISDKSRKSVIEATFTAPDPEIEKIFIREGLDWNSDEMIVRREISPNGRSRAFINDSPVTLPVLLSVTGNLLDIHSQHSNIILSEAASQLNIIDSYSRIEDKIKSYRKDFQKYVALRSQIKRIKEQAEKNKQNREFISFQLEQLDKIKPLKGELSKVEQEFDILSDADRINENLSLAYSSLDGSDNAALTLVSHAEEYLQKIDLGLLSESDTENDLISRIENIRIELRDISETIRDYIESIDCNPVKLDQVTKRMNLLYDSVKRFKVKDYDELLNLHQDLKSKLHDIDYGDHDVSNLEKEAKGIALNLKSQADEISSLREEGAHRFTLELQSIAQNLGLPNIRFEVEITRTKLTSDGQDSIEFLCSFNKKHPKQPISKVASGGEISRLMLSIKRIMATCMSLPTIIFDEIDTGVSGEIADKMGRMMNEMGKDMQVLAVTHLPQVAAKGNSHFKVYKTDEDDRTVSHVIELDMNSRITELASMLSGSEVNDEARANARVLLNLRNN